MLFFYFLGFVSYIHRNQPIINHLNNNTFSVYKIRLFCRRRENRQKKKIFISVIYSSVWNVYLMPFRGRVLDDIGIIFTNIQVRTPWALHLNNRKLTFVSFKPVISINIFIYVKKWFGRDLLGTFVSDLWKIL